MSAVASCRWKRRSQKSPASRLRLVGEDGWYAGDQAAQSAGEPLALGGGKVRNQLLEALGELIVELVDRVGSGRCESHLDNPAITRIALPYDEAAVLGAVDQAGEAGPFETQDRGEVCHAEGVLGERAQHLRLRNGEVAAAADLGVQVLHQERQPDQPARRAESLLHTGLHL